MSIPSHRASVTQEALSFPPRSHDMDGHGTDTSLAVQCMFSDKPEGREFLEGDGKYIKVHPFAGQELREWLTTEMRLAMVSSGRQMSLGPEFES